MTIAEKFAKIAEIEREYQSECCGYTLTLEDELAMAQTGSEDDPYYQMNIDSILEQMAEMMSRIQAVLEA